MENSELTNNCVNCTSEGRKVLGEINNSRCAEAGNPLSPTANLKLLTKVASNFERNRVRPISQDEKLASNVNEVRKKFTFHYVQNQPDDNSKSRKEKSLSLLCNKFLQLFPMDLPPGDHMMISLDQAATTLGTERRRIYDIINVLESLQMAAKENMRSVSAAVSNCQGACQQPLQIGKNRYAWYGCQQLHLTLSQLKGLAERLGLREQLHAIQQKQKASYVRVVTDLSEESEVDVKTSEIHLQSSSLQKLESNVTAQTDISVLPDNTMERSLGVMCQKFIMLFLVSNKCELVNLDLAATILIGEGAEKPTKEDAHSEHESRAGRFKTKVRRLYDIANVLTSLGLICKVPSGDNSIRKPAFKYTGPHVEAVSLSDEDVQLFNATRHSLLGNSPYVRPHKTPCESRKRKPAGEFELSARVCCTRPVKRNPRPEDGGSLDEILHVAEMELKRLESLETSKSARKKLFGRHPEPCISTTRKLVKVSDILMNQTTNRCTAPSIQSVQSLPAIQAPESSNTMLHIQPPAQPATPAVLKLPDLTRPAIVLTPTQNAGVLYRIVKVGRVVQLMPLCKNPVK